MNRDEKLTRDKGLPPKFHQVAGRTVLGPSEPGGGSWIAVNDTGATLALINWYAVKAVVKTRALSRGVVVNSVRAAAGKDEIDSTLAGLPLATQGAADPVRHLPAGAAKFSSGQPGLASPPAPLPRSRARSVLNLYASP